MFFAMSLFTNHIKSGRPLGWPNRFIIQRFSFAKPPSIHIGSASRYLSLIILFERLKGAFERLPSIGTGVEHTLKRDTYSSLNFLC